VSREATTHHYFNTPSFLKRLSGATGKECARLPWETPRGRTFLTCAARLNPVQGSMRDIAEDKQLHLELQNGSTMNTLQIADEGLLIPTLNVDSALIDIPGYSSRYPNRVCRTRYFEHRGVILTKLPYHLLGSVEPLIEV
jgi:hypothetical protein